jgi:muramoyltetrapeptide carboxypeptidase
MTVCAGIVSPARWLDSGALRAACGALEAAGIEVAIPDQNFAKCGQFAGDDRSRAEALNNLYANDRVDVILCARGGYGASRILDFIDYDLISANPKPLIGYSDITALLCVIADRTEAPVWHGPMLTDIARGLDSVSFERLLGVIRDQADPLPRMDLSVLRPGLGEGPIVGGNLSILATLCGTPYHPDMNGRVLFIEDTDEPAYGIDRMILQLRLAGAFDRIEGLILGNFSEIRDAAEFGSGVEDIVLNLCKGTEFPILSGLRAGHSMPNLAIRLGTPFFHAS